MRLLILSVVLTLAAACGGDEAGGPGPEFEPVALTGCLEGGPLGSYVLVVDGRGPAAGSGTAATSGQAPDDRRSTGSLPVNTRYRIAPEGQGDRLSQMVGDRVTVLGHREVVPQSGTGAPVHAPEGVPGQPSPPQGDPAHELIRLESVERVGDCGGPPDPGR